MERILIVEDEHEVAETMAVALRRRGHQVDLAHTLAQAMKTSANDYPVILLDILLGTEKSFPFLKKIKEDNPSAIVIMVTAYDEDENVREAKRLGADAFLTKPFMTEYLENLIISKINSLKKK
ncbi:MAG: response regulator [Candidatus Omnitrophota bacterium]|nr:response regulator [Candidatus Omnitrophota bacterium]